MKKTLFTTLLVLIALAAKAQDVQPAPVAVPVPATDGSGTTIQVPPFKGVAISGLTLICKGSETLLKVEGDYESFEWNTGSTERIIRVKEAGQYEVKVRTKGGCQFTSSVNVEVRPCTLP